MRPTRKPGRLLLVLGVLVGAASLLAPVATAAVPVNTTRPAISGEAREGQTLTAQNGTWQNSPTSFRYQWQRCDASGSSCVNLAAQTQRTYTLDADDVGKTVRVVVTAVNADGTGTAASSPTAVVSSSSPPKSTAKPTITGTARVGEELAADEGEWSGAPDRFAFQWQRCERDATGCVDVTGATGRTYGVRAADAQHRLRVTVKATNAAGSSTAASEPTAVVVESTPAPAANQRPRITLLSARLLGSRVYARFRVCDDSRKNVTIIQTDQRRGVPSFTRRFSTLRPPLKCALYSRTWTPASRFLAGDGRFVVILRARDKSGLTSLAVRRVFFI